MAVGGGGALPRARAHVVGRSGTYAVRAGCGGAWWWWGALCLFYWFRSAVSPRRWPARPHGATFHPQPRSCSHTRPCTVQSLPNITRTLLAENSQGTSGFGCGSETPFMALYFRKLSFFVQCRTELARGIQRSTHPGPLGSEVACQSMRTAPERANSCEALRPVRTYST